MNVYLLWEGEYEDRYVAGVYATRHAAEAAHHHHEFDADGRCAWSFPAVKPAEGYSYTFDTLEVPVVNGVATLPTGRLVKVAEGVNTVVVPVQGKTPWSVTAMFGTPARYCDTAAFIEERPVAVLEPVG